MPHAVGSPDVGGEREHEGPAHQKQPLPVWEAVGQPSQEHGPHSKAAVLQDDGTGPLHAHQPLGGCAEAERTKSQSARHPQGSPCTQPTEKPWPCSGWFRSGQGSSACSWPVLGPKAALQSKVVCLAHCAWPLPDLPVPYVASCPFSSWLLPPSASCLILVKARFWAHGLTHGGQESLWSWCFRAWPPRCRALWRLPPAPVSTPGGGCCGAEQSGGHLGLSRHLGLLNCHVTLSRLVNVLRSQRPPQLRDIRIVLPKGAVMR